ncbi:hypothetical protein [Arthrobacter sp. D3-16]
MKTFLQGSVFLKDRENDIGYRWLIGFAASGFLALLMMTTFIQLGLTPTPANAQSGTIDSACGPARELATKDPPAALELIDKIRSGAPGTLPAPVPSNIAGEVATVSQACESERLIALAAAGRKLVAPDPPAPPAQFKDLWEGIDKKWVSLLQGLVFLGIVAVLLVVARLIALLPFLARKRTDPARQRQLLWWGLGFLIVGTGLLVAVLPHVAAYAENPDRDTNILIVPVAALIALGTALLSRALAGRLRMNVTVHDGDGKQNRMAAGRLVAILSELGGKPSAGVEIPYAVDVSALSEAALVTVPNHKVIALLHQLLQFIFNSTPWSAVVDGTEDAISILISRNGRAVDTTLISRDEFALITPIRTAANDGTKKDTGTPPLPDLYKMAAALILTNLAKRHDGFEGLCEAGDWRSVGLHFIATTDYEANDRKALPLLAAAMEYDPRNRAADLALHHHQYRQAEKKDDLRFYAKWLKEQELHTRADTTGYSAINPVYQSRNTKAGFLDLRRRLLVNYMIAVLNLRSIAGCQSAEPLASQYAKLLMELLRVDDRQPDPLADEMRPVATELVRELREQEQSVVRPVVARMKDRVSVDGESPRLAYNRACAAAQAYLRAERRSEKEHARIMCLQHLRIAVLVSQYKEWARKDPSLQPMHVDSEFGEVIGTAPRRDFWEIAALKPYQTPLLEAGVPKPKMLADRLRHRPYLRRYLEISPAKFDRLLRVSGIVQHAEEYSRTHNGNFATFKVELVAALLEQGIERPEELSDPKETAAELLRATVQRCLRGPGEEDVENWLSEWKQSAPPAALVKL